MKKVYKRKRGITLVELLVAIGIFGIVMVITGSIINYSSKFYVKSNQNLKGASEARIGMSYVINRLREYETLDAVEISNGNGNDYGTITFSKKDATTSNMVPLSIIEFEDGKLIEKQYNNGVLSSESSTIAYLSHFSIAKVLRDESDLNSWDKRTVKITIKYKDSSSTDQVISTVLNRKCKINVKTS